MKKIIVVILVFTVMLLNSTLSYALPASSITEELEGHWAKDKILSLLELEIINGIPTQDGIKIFPDKIITRAEYVKVITKAYDLELIPEKVIMFKDVKEGDWFKEYVDIATSNAIVSGYPDNTFRPNNEITRAEIAALTVRINGWTEADINKEIPDFDDVSPDSWYYKAVMICKSKGIISGYPNSNTFKPNNFATRAEAFTVVKEDTVVYEEDEKQTTGGTTNGTTDGTPEGDVQQPEETDMPISGGLTSSQPTVMPTVQPTPTIEPTIQPIPAIETTTEPTAKPTTSPQTQIISTEESFDLNLQDIGAGTFNQLGVTFTDAQNIIENNIKQLTLLQLQDAFACDRSETKTFRVAFEDLSPYSSVGNDLDYNDFVVDLKVDKFYSNGILRAILVNYEPMARGAGYDHTFGVNMVSAYVSNGDDYMLSWDTTTSANIDTIKQNITSYSNSQKIQLAESTKDVLAPNENEMYSNTEMTSMKVNASKVGGFLIVVKNSLNNSISTPVIDEYEFILEPKTTNIHISTKDSTEGKLSAIVKDINWLWPIERVNINDGYDSSFSTPKDTSKLYTK